MLVMGSSLLAAALHWWQQDRGSRSGLQEREQAGGLGARVRTHACMYLEQKTLIHTLIMQGGSCCVGEGR